MVGYNVWLNFELKGKKIKKFRLFYEYYLREFY